MSSSQRRFARTPGPYAGQFPVCGALGVLVHAGSLGDLVCARKKTDKPICFFQPQGFISSIVSGPCST